MTSLLLMGVLSATVGLAPSNQPRPRHSAEAVCNHHHHEHHTNVIHGTGDAFRTAGSGVAYGTRTVGRALTGRSPDERDRSKMEHHARETREEFRGH